MSVGDFILRVCIRRRVEVCNFLLFMLGLYDFEGLGYIGEFFVWEGGVNGIGYRGMWYCRF